MTESREPEMPRLRRRKFTFNFDEFRVGTAEYVEGPTGCTVLHFPHAALAAVDVRGGAAALRESTVIDPLSSWSEADAIVLAGGSTYGLEAASGVMKRLLEARQSTKFADIPSVPAAVVYDFAGRDNLLYPDVVLGARAYDEAVVNSVMIGEAGAGANVRVGKCFGRELSERSGQGAAFLEKDGVKIFAITVVNALGNILDRSGKVIAGSRDPRTGERKPVIEGLRSRPSAPASGNTTISAIVTNAKVDRLQLQRIAVMAHTAMGRMIEPFHTPSDGDALFALSTRSFDLPTNWGAIDLGTISGHLLQNAILEAVGK